MEEIWKDVLGYEGRYEISSLGRLRGPRGITEGSIGSRGYVQVCLREKGSMYGKSKNIHVLVAETFLGERPEGFHVCHEDGNKLNNTLTNLRYDTPQNNWNDFRKRPGESRHSIAKTECPIGHPLEVPNLMKSQLSRGWRSCLACNRARSYARANSDKKINIELLANSYYERIVNE
jgi:hypothetical protein